MDNHSICPPATADAAVFYVMLLQRLPEFGPASYWQMLSHFGSVEQFLGQPRAVLANLLNPAACELVQRYQQQREESDLARRVIADMGRLQEGGIAILHPEHPAYPRLLREAPRAPFVLYARGNLDCLQTPQIAVVGSRKPSSTGRENAHQFSAYLAQAGFTITSGLALGVDGAAHQGALDGGGHTIAVMGTSVDRLYPARHRKLAEHILVEGGLLVSEFPLGTGPNQANFPQRNRIISGLCLGVLVVEAAPKSGSLITARFAMQQNREVFAIPGSIHNPLSRGCHGLIREGATLVETAADMLPELQGLLALKAEESAWVPPQPEAPLQAGLFDPSPMTVAATKPRRKTRPSSKQIDDRDASLSAVDNRAVDLNSLDREKAEELVLQCLGHDAATIDMLVARLGGNAGTLSALLITLEIKGLVEQTPLGYQRLGV